MYCHYCFHYYDIIYLKLQYVQHGLVALVSTITSQKEGSKFKPTIQGVQNY